MPSPAFLDLYPFISYELVSSQTNDKRDDLHFDIVNFPCFISSSNIFSITFFINVCYLNKNNTKTGGVKPVSALCIIF